MNTLKNHNSGEENYGQSYPIVDGFHVIFTTITMYAADLSYTYHGTLCNLIASDK